MGERYWENGGKWEKLRRLREHWRGSRLILNPSVGRGPSAECDAPFVWVHMVHERGQQWERGPMDCMQTLHAPPPPMYPQLLPYSSPFFPISPHSPPLFLRPSRSIPTPCVPSALKPCVFHLFGGSLITIFPLGFQRRCILTDYPPFPRISPVSEQCSGKVPVVGISSFCTRTSLSPCMGIVVRPLGTLRIGHLVRPSTRCSKT